MRPDCTFPVVHNPEHPLVVGVLDEDPVTTQAVGRVLSESVLHRQPGEISEIRTPPEASAGREAFLSIVRFLLIASNAALCLRSCSRVSVSEPLIQFLNTRLSAFFFLCLPSLTFYVLIFFFSQHALAKCLPAGDDVRSCHSQRSGLQSAGEDPPPGPALLCVLCYAHTDPTHQTHLFKDPQRAANIHMKTSLTLTFQINVRQHLRFRPIKHKEHFNIPSSDVSQDASGSQLSRLCENVANFKRFTLFFIHYHYIIIFIFRGTVHPQRGRKASFFLFGTSSAPSLQLRQIRFQLWCSKLQK